MERNVRPVEIRLEGVCQEYPNPDGTGVRHVLEDINLHLDKPGINMLLGPSGCGKTTLLRIMGGVRPYGIKCPTRGRVYIDGSECHAAHDDAVTVMQQYSNFPHLTVRENVELPLRLRLWKRRIPKEEQKRRIETILAHVGLADLASNRPAQLSGGQNQRLALAQALVLKPRILLMDEPFGALDAQTRAEMQELLVRLWDEEQCCVIFVTHDITEALLLGNKVMVLAGRPSRNQATFDIHVPRPRTESQLREEAINNIRKKVVEILRDGGSHEPQGMEGS